MGFRALTERLTGTHIYRDLPRGLDVFHDIAMALPAFDVTTVLDVGANVGQSAQVFLNKFPRAHVYCFEPVASTFAELERRMAESPRISCHCCALGEATRAGQMVLLGSSDRYFLRREEPGLPQVAREPVEAVPVTTLDLFCEAQHIDQIGYLKIDTEGGDLDVLKGAESLLYQQRVDLVQVEAGMNPFNCLHVSFEALKAFLEERKYYLFGIYEQVREWPTRSPHLRRSNPVFISNRLISSCGNFPDRSRW